jgi:predicted adenine nucleotide alpha hydrolase (AANH) superfamily ATPase
MLLLHTCCAPCSAAVIEWLRMQEVYPTLFFFNPNIYPQNEYEIRKNELIRYALSLKMDYIEGDYDREIWQNAIKGLEDQPERGSRCLECFKMRLLTTARLASEKGFSQIATTLASSRWKNLRQITEAGNWAAAQFPGLQFLEKNWRKDGLSERRRILLRENGFYNQTYCGCEYSGTSQRRDTII